MPGAKVFAEKSMGAVRLRNASLVTENRILRNHTTGRVRLSDGERQTLAKIGKKPGKQALAETVHTGKLTTMLAWHRQLVLQKCDGSQRRHSPGRPTTAPELEAVRMAQENRAWGYDRIVGVTPYPNAVWMVRVARNLTMEAGGLPSPGQSGAGGPASAENLQTYYTTET